MVETQAIGRGTIESRSKKYSSSLRKSFAAMLMSWVSSALVDC
jgi:hypothetical protein